MSVAEAGAVRHGALVDLYSAFLTTAPVILLTIASGITFGPAPERARHRAWRIPRWQLASVVLIVFLVVGGAWLALLVLGGFAPDADWARQIVVGAGGLSLFLLMLHVLADVLRPYLKRDGTPGE